MCVHVYVRELMSVYTLALYPGYSELFNVRTWICGHLMGVRVLSIHKIFLCSSFFFFFIMSKEFRSEYGRLHELRALVPCGTPYVACTATATRSIKEEAISNLEMYACATVMTLPDRANIYYEVLSRTEISKDLQFLVEHLKKNEE